MSLVGFRDWSNIMVCEYCGVEHPKDQKNNPFYCIERLKEKIELMDSLIFGEENHYGLYDCLDGYYISCFSEKVEKLRGL